MLGKYSRGLKRSVGKLYPLCPQWYYWEHREIHGSDFLSWPGFYLTMWTRAVLQMVCREVTGFLERKQYLELWLHHLEGGNRSLGTRRSLWLRQLWAGRQPLFAKQILLLFRMVSSSTRVRCLMGRFISVHCLAMTCSSQTSLFAWGLEPQSDELRQAKIVACLYQTWYSKAVQIRIKNWPK